MAQTRGEIDQHLAARLGGQAARSAASRVARRLYRTQAGDGVYQLDEGALLDDCFSCLRELGVVDWRRDVRRTAIPRERVPVVQSVLR
jgi:hypothetical protein